MKNKYFAIVVSRFNEPVTKKLLEGAKARFKELDIKDEQIEIYQVPGAVEIPLIAKKLAHQKRFTSIICLGAVIRGETTHYDYVCQQVSYGCQRVALDYELPVIFGVLTTENEEQAFDRLGGAHGHKGRDAVDTAIETVECLESIDRLH